MSFEDLFIEKDMVGNCSEFSCDKKAVYFAVSKKGNVQDAKYCLEHYKSHKIPNNICPQCKWMKKPK